MSISPDWYQAWCFVGIVFHTNCVIWHPFHQLLISKDSLKDDKLPATRGYYVSSYSWKLTPFKSSGCLLVLALRDDSSEVRRSLWCIKKADAKKNRSALAAYHLILAWQSPMH